jgi:hypothetical protein
VGTNEKAAIAFAALSYFPRPYATPMSDGSFRNEYEIKTDMQITFAHWYPFSAVSSFDSIRKSIRAEPV